MQRISQALLLLVLLISFLIVWGGVVRVTGSGLGCPDWPLCHGQWIPPFEKEVLIEYAHRLLASLVGFLTIGVSLAVWFQRERRLWLGKWCGAAIVLLFVQVLLGGVTVKSELHPYVVASHMAVALLFLAVIFYMVLLVVKRGNKTGIPKTIPYHLSHWTLTLLLLQMVLGSLVAASNAGLACPDFPTCQGVWIPRMEGLVALHFLHRAGAGVVFLSILFLTLGTWERRATKIIFLLGLFQIALGVANVLLGLALWVRLTHLGLGVGLFLCLVQSTYELRRLESLR